LQPDSINLFDIFSLVQLQLTCCFHSCSLFLAVALHSLAYCCYFQPLAWAKGLAEVVVLQAYSGSQDSKGRLTFYAESYERTHP